MTIELHPLLHSKKLIKRENIGFQYFVPQFWMWLIVISREKVVYVKVTDISCEFKILYLILMLPKIFGNCLPTLENISSNTFVGNSCSMLIFMIV